MTLAIHPVLPAPPRVFDRKVLVAGLGVLVVFMLGMMIKGSGS